MEVEVEVEEEVEEGGVERGSRQVDVGEVARRGRKRVAAVAAAAEVVRVVVVVVEARRRKTRGAVGCKVGGEAGVPTEGEVAGASDT